MLRLGARIAVALLMLFACSSRKSTEVSRDDGGTGTGGSSGSAGTDAATGGTAGSGGSGGASGGCSPPLTPGGNRLFHQSFNGLAALGTPDVGSSEGYTTTLEVGDFASGLCDLAAHFSDSSKKLRYAEAVGSDAHIDYQEGALRFWYRPDYAADDIQQHPLVQSSNFAGRGGIRLYRIREGGVHKLLFQFRAPAADGGTTEWTASARVSGGMLSQNQWTFLLISWKVGTPLRMWVGGTEVDYATGTQETPAAAATASVNEELILASDPAGTLSAAGWIDDLRIYDTAIP